MRYLRLIIGAVLVLGTLYVIIVEQMAGASSDAVVNAPVISLRAPVAGRVSVSSVALGAGVDKGENLASISDPRSDRVRLDDLLMDRDLARAEVARLNAVREQQVKRGNWLDGRFQRYRIGRLRELGVSLPGEAEVPAVVADPDKAATPAPEAQEAALPAEPDTGSDAPSESDAPFADTPDGIRAEAARQGIFLDGSASPIWNFDLRRFDAENRLSEVTIELNAARSRLVAIETRIERERQRVNALAGADIDSPVRGLVWEQLAGDGVTVQRGDPIMRVVSCEDAIVTLSVTEPIFNSLNPGDTATFRFSGSGQTLPGTVARLAGLGAATVYRELAIAPDARHLERYDVSLIVPGLEDASGTCPVGRTGRVFFDDRPLDLLRRFWN